MAMTVGQAGFFRDGTGTVWPCVVTADQGGDTYSLIAFVEDYWRSYGPSVAGGPTADATPVPFDLSATPYTVSETNTQTVVNAELDAAALAAANASAQAGLDQTPLPLVRVDTGGGGGWSFNLTTQLWECRQPSRKLALWYSCPRAWAALRWIVRDYADVGTGRIVVQVLAAPRFGAIGAVNYTTRATWASAGTGTQQENVSALTPPMAQTIVRVEVVTGSFGPTAIGSEYRFEQLSPEI